MRIQEDRYYAAMTPLQVALVGCGKSKSERINLLAKDLYTGIPFRMAFDHAKNTADDIHILSAMHGLLDPYVHIAPYDMTMVEILPDRHIEWGRQVLADLKAAYPLQRLAITFYAGQQYVRPIMRAITDETAYWTFNNPLEGMGLFERLKWFKANRPHEEDA